MAGFFRSYEVAFIAADERDVVKVRSTVRGEDVRLYRLDIRPQTARRLLETYVAVAQDVADSSFAVPAFNQSIDKQIAEVAAGRADAPSGWKWVYHAPPSSLPVSWSGQRHFGDPSLADWIERYKPDFVFCGHVHEAPFSRGGSWVARQGETLVFNPGKQIGGFPTHIVLDTERREAVWFSLEGAERLDWSVPATAKPEPLYEMPGWMPA